jgi:hypothetical protein
MENIHQKALATATGHAGSSDVMVAQRRDAVHDASKFAMTDLVVGLCFGFVLGGAVVNLIYLCLK